MPKTKRVLALDLDDVLKDTWHALCLHHNECYGTSHTPEEVFTSDLTEFWNCSDAEKEARLWRFFHSEHHDAGLPVVGATSALERLSEHFEFHVVTARFLNVRHRTVPWIERHYPGVFADIHLTGSPYQAEGNERLKSEVCQEIGACAFIDDSIANVRDVARFGIRTFLFTTPNNRNWELPHGAVRVSSWEEIERHLMPV